MPRSSLRRGKAVNYNEDGDDRKSVASETAAEAKAASSTSKTDRPLAKRKADAEELEEEDEDQDRPDSKTRQTKKQTKKPKANEKPQDEAMVATRTPVASLKKAMYIGAHVSAAGGVHNAIANAVQIGANSFALFLKSQRKWSNPAMTGEAKAGFTEQCKQHSYSAHEHALPHGSYLVNLAQGDKDKARQAYDSFVDDLRRCEQLGIRLYNFHPGSAGSDSRTAAVGRIAAQLNRAHGATKTVVTVLENMAGSGSVVGSTWEDLRDIIALVDDKARVGVCIDTCHAFAAGYDMRTHEAFEATMRSFDDVVGSEYLRAFHLNDSKAPFGSNRDLHANIGTGFLGLRAFHSIMNTARFQGMPMVLETPIDSKDADGKTVEDKNVWAREIKLLESLIGMDADSDEFRELEVRLQAEGASERKKIQDQVDRKQNKTRAKGKTAKKK